MEKCIKTLMLFLIVSLIATSMSCLAESEIKVAIDGEYVEFDVKPQIINDRTMVPLRAIFEALGTEVDWDNATQTVRAMKDNVMVTASIGSTKMYIDEKEKNMDVAPMLIDGRTLVPVRFVAEAFECKVDWVTEDSLVAISTRVFEVIGGTITEIQGDD